MNRAAAVDKVEVLFRNILILDDLATGKSSLLKNVTAGYHYHTVAADTVEVLDLIENKLRESGFLAPLQKYEPNGVKTSL